MNPQPHQADTTYRATTTPGCSRTPPSHLEHQHRPQAGTARPVAVYLDGTNVMSVFGLQGAGKAGTVGTLYDKYILRRRRFRPHRPQDPSAAGPSRHLLRVRLTPQSALRRVE